MTKILKERLPYMKFLTEFKWENLTPGEKELITYLLIEPIADGPFIRKMIGQKKLSEWVWEYFLLDHEHSDWYFKLSDEAKAVVLHQLKQLSPALPADHEEDPYFMREAEKYGYKHCSFRITDEESMGRMMLRRPYPTDNISPFLMDALVSYMNEPVVAPLNSPEINLTETPAKSVYLSQEVIDAMDNFTAIHNITNEDLVHLSIADYLSKKAPQ